MSSTPTPEDYRWLTTAEARPWLARAAGDPQTLVARAQRLRAVLGPLRTHLVLELVELRERATVKFSHADQMFFTRRLLEQATDEALGRYKASRFPVAQPAADLCCGCGGDLLGLAAHRPVTGVDQDPVAVLFAQANVRAAEVPGPGIELRMADVDAVDVAAWAAWHLDPDRRSSGRRTTRVERYQPGLETIQRLLQANPQAGIKLAPATGVPPAWADGAELEFLESRGECRQQVAWFGPLAHAAGRRTATVVAAGDALPCSISGLPDEPVPVAAAVQRYIFEPCAAVLAARLTGTLAAARGLLALAPAIAYLTGDEPQLDPLLAGFEICEILPFDHKRLRGVLRQRRIGRLEIKQRGVHIDPAQTLARLHPAGPDAATLLLFPQARSVTAILARRLNGQRL